MTTYTRFGAIASLLILSCVLVVPFIVLGQGITADAQCKPPGPPKDGGKDGLPCKLGVSGGSQYGICAGGICIGKGSAPGEGAAGEGVQGGATQGLDMLKGIIDQVMQKMGGGGGGGGGSGTGTTPPDCSANTTSDWRSGKCQDIGVAKEIFNTINTGSKTSSGDTLINSILKGFDDNPQPLPKVNVTNVTSVPTTPSQNASSSAAQIGFTAAPSPSSSTPNGTTNTSGTAVIPNANVDLTTNVQENTDGVIVTSAGVDAETNTGVSGFFGFLSGRSATHTESGESMFGRLCTAKPWNSSLITRIFSARFFDALCERRGGNAQENTVLHGTNTVANPIILRCPSIVQPGNEVTIEWSCGEGVRSSGIGFVTKGNSSGKVTGRPAQTKQYTLECAQGGSRSCVIEVANPHVEIVAHPERVQLGARSRLYWVGEGVESCTVTGPGLTENGAKGAVTTGAILDSTTFTISCVGVGGATTTDSVTVDVGA